MILRPNEIEVDPSDPWAGDDLGRQEVGETLSAFLASLTGPFVVAVEAPWGAGKSTFLRRLACHLELDGIPVIQVDAWRNDYLQDPMLAFMAAVRGRVLKKSSTAKKVAGTIASGIAKHGAALCETLISTAAKTVAPGIGDAVVAFAELTTKLGSTLLDFQEAHEKSQEAFARSITKAREFLTKGGPRPIVFIIDELDRCRPDFAVQALERIKHFFDIPGVIFVLATDGANLPSAISSVYGVQTDSERYLRKFIDFSFNMPDPSPHDFVGYLYKTFAISDLLPHGMTFDEAMAQRDNMGERYRENMGQKFTSLDVVRQFPEIASALSISLRDQIQAFTIVSCILRSVPMAFPILASTLCYVVCVRFADIDVYRNLRAGRTSLYEIVVDHSPSSSAESRPGIERLGAKTRAGIALRLEGLALHTPYGVRRQALEEECRRMVTDSDELDREIDRARICVRRLNSDFNANKYIKDLLRIAEAFTLKDPH